MLAALAASILGGGGLGGYGASDQLYLNPYDPYAGAALDAGGTRGRQRQRRVPQVVPPRSAASPVQNEYRVEVSGQGATARCSGCNAAVGELTTRIGMRVQAQRNPGPWRWYHLACLPSAYWHEARLRGVANLRGIPPAEQARVREHLRHRG